MDLASPAVRIAVVRPAEAGAGAPDAASVLGRLGGPVEIERVDGAAACLRLVERSDIHLVIVEAAPNSAAAPAWQAATHDILSALRASGPPVVVIVDPEAGSVSHDAFRMGAADCVSLGEDYAEALLLVALEQVRRWRRVCERNRAQERIRWLEDLNDAIVAQNPDALLVADADGRVVIVNPEFSRAFEVAAEATVDQPLESVLPDAIIDSAGLRDALAGDFVGRGQAPRLAQWDGPEGERRVFDVRWQRLDEEGRVLFVLSDVTERHWLARRVDDLRRYNENIIQSINSALLVVDNAGEIVFANATAELVLGARSGELVGRLVWDWFRSTPRDRVHISRSLLDGERFRGAEAVVTRDDGTIVPIGISSTPLTDGDGAKLGVVAIFQDLTEIKELQRQVLQNEKMASIGQLAAGVAHEINNPVGFIHANLFQMSEYVGDLRRVWGQVEELQRAVATGQLEAIRIASKSLDSVSAEVDIGFVLGDFSKAVRESQEGSERIRHIVKDLRDFSHPDTAEPLLADVTQCVDSTANIVWTMMKHSVVLEKEYCELPEIRCFPMQLKQVFMNLLVNAYQSIEERVGDSGETGQISIRTGAVGDGVLVAIRDTGAGIAPENLAHLFDPFFTTKEVGTGTGLGLSTSYSIVQRHGGTIHVESELERGSTFEVWLPRDGPGSPGGAG